VTYNTLLGLYGLSASDLTTFNFFKYACLKACACSPHPASIHR
jgi:hypothetical protein